ncbi:MAG: hypothetical protein HZA15_10535 [Nitrospirae bacterium]|nr:hypothetical protein [Nitrospirota bacterium]
MQRETGISTSRMSLIETEQVIPKEDEKTAIAGFFHDIAIEWLFTHLDTATPGVKSYKSIFTPRKLAPAIQAKLDEEIVALKKELAEYKAREPERIKATAERIARHFTR